MKNFITKSIDASICNLESLGCSKREIFNIAKIKTGRSLLLELLNLEEKYIEENNKLLSQKFDNYRGYLNKLCAYFDKDNLICKLDIDNCKDCKNILIF